MSFLLRIGFAIVVGLLVYGLLVWLATTVPHNIDVLLGTAAAFIAYWQAPGVFPGNPVT